ncbi:phosphopantothenoylcysteine decarboxylase/phosphopantothenate/cysteine ligase [[Bacillus] selenitireducens MLS10]|uniref:Coenzyme A biosynthesis bifunctional protein CoaBC n=1 Tax=Bacillus selenitireducens (strain ATCC 700615 / DSM 15326 / MLS10) TaxID=439292 RepID=D6XTR2_BACIE|nr:bifunctional phosphopantothenoylcysteine decarboxylase/phosphopantothenate--cysteine ligase CoaBC [Salisediminibacterium selenitireducens]ADH99198.1 phosphopantothenoylcysteine decarboxylase/phosphopantothenate/cysteine ligase [[Bacillus] selenitireducens MLS10]
MNQKKRILLCVSGGIAVFKAAALTSKLTQNDYEVKVLMTQSAEKFVTPLTFQALSRGYVHDDTFDEPEPDKIAHIDAADWADLIVIAPATANVLGKLANGIADDMVTTTLMAATAPILVAPAMNVHMYQHPAVQRNMTTLEEFGYRFIEPDDGYLACGYTGKGRMAEPEDLLAAIDHHFIRQAHREWHGKRVLVTAGPTVEAVDPVRYFTNRSSGKMGFAVAEEAAARGAHVTLIAGPTALATPHGVQRIDVKSAEDMYKEVHRAYPDTDLVIKAAAVADYKPEDAVTEKIKKQDDVMTLSLVKTPDILKSLGEQKKDQVLVGFAAESQQVEEYGRKKLHEKQLDAIAINHIAKEGMGFDGDTNEIMLIFQNGREVTIPLSQKRDVARHLLDEIEPLITGRGS